MKTFVLHAAVAAVLFALQFVLPEYHHANAARIMVYALLAMGYNVLFGYTGLMSLGHALFFAAGAYGAGLAVYWHGFPPLPAFVMGLFAALAVSMAAGIVLLRTTGVAFLIVTLMLAQAFYLSMLYFNTYTLGDQGMVLSNTAPLALFGLEFPLSNPSVKYNIAWTSFTVILFATAWLARSPMGRVLVAIRENEPRTLLLGYDTARYRYLAVVISGTISGVSGALYALLFSYVGASFATLKESTIALLYTLLGGPGTVLGPVIGTGLMFYLVDIASGLTQSYLIIVGLALVALTLWFPKGIAGSLKRRFPEWLP